MEIKINKSILTCIPDKCILYYAAKTFFRDYSTYYQHCTGYVNLLEGLFLSKLDPR